VTPKLSASVLDMVKLSYYLEAVRTGKQYRVSQKQLDKFLKSVENNLKRPL